MKGTDCVIYPREKMRNLMHFLIKRTDRKFYESLQKEGLLTFFSEIKEDIRDEEEP